MTTIPPKADVGVESEESALQLARAAFASSAMADFEKLIAAGWVKISAVLPTEARVYGLDILEPCWFVVYPEPRATGTASSRLIVIRKSDGSVLYHDSAHDEG